MNRWITFSHLMIWSALPCLPCQATEESHQPAEIMVGHFTTPGKALPDGWKLQTFDPKKIPVTSQYEQVKMDGRVVLKGTTHSGASLVYCPVKIDWHKYPFIAWHWRVDQVFAKKNERTKSGDDYPARLYIAFKYDPNRVGWWTRHLFERARKLSPNGSYPPLYTLTYVWATREPVGATYPNPYQDRVRMIVSRSGKQGLKAWHEESHNYVEDFKSIFGEDPPQVEFVAIMIDGDNTKSSGVCYFDDIRFLAKKPALPAQSKKRPSQ